MGELRNVKAELTWTPDPETRERMHVACRSLATSYADFILFAVRQALDELEALGREQKAIRDYYQRTEQ